MKILSIILAALLDIVPAGNATLEQLQKRDSILIADQLRYSVTLKDLDKDSGIALPDLSQASNDTLTIIGGWQLDTLVRGRKVHSRNAKAAARILQKPFDLCAGIVLAPFEEGTYELPDIPVVRRSGDKIDTLIFKGLEMEVKESVRTYLRACFPSEEEDKSERPCVVSRELCEQDTLTEQAETQESHL